MADKPTGPVKPPTLDLTARKAGTDTGKTAGSASTESGAPPADAPASPRVEAKDKSASQAKMSEGPAKDAPKPAPPQKPSAATAELPIIALAATGLGGAVLGLATAYGLALAGFWPASPADTTVLETRIASVQTMLERNSGAISELGNRIGAIEDAGPAEIPQLPENLLTAEALDPLQSRIDALGVQIEAVAAGMPADESAELATEISRLGAGLADLETRLVQPDSEIEALTSQLASLTARFETLEAQAANQASIDAMRAERDRFARLPAATAALETAIGSGAPFAAELAAIENLVPELGITNPVRTIAASGVKPARDISRDFRALIPALLAARPEDPQAGWLETLVAQAQSVIALRPVDDDSETPQALVGRIETALDAGNASAARALILQLPEPMQAVAAPVRADLDALIAAQALVGDIRALAPQAMEASQ